MSYTFVHIRGPGIVGAQEPTFADHSLKSFGNTGVRVSWRLLFTAKIYSEI